MLITRKQMRNFKRINEKLKTNSLFFVANHSYLVKKYSYLKKCHFIVKCQLKLKKRKVVLPFNQLIKFGLNRKDDGKKLNPKKLQKKCHVRGGKSDSRIRLKPKPGLESVDGKDSVESKTVAGSSEINDSTEQSTSQTAMEIEKVPDAATDDCGEKKDVSSEDVNKQIREQLKLLQSGRRSSISFLASNSNTPTRPSSIVGTKTPSCGSTPTYSRHPSHSSLENESIRAIDEKPSTSNGPSESPQNTTSQKPPKFIDSLISKLKTQGLNLPAPAVDDSQTLSAHSSPDKAIPSVPKSSFTRESSVDMPFDNDVDDRSSTSSKSGFLGFEEADTQFEMPNIPGMLPTPLVRKPKGVKSAFVSEDLDKFMKENALDNSAYTTEPLKKRLDEALMYAEAEPPSLLCPQLPSDVEKPRTVAEKRQLLERKADIKYLMIENESTVYRELRKRAKNGPGANVTLIRNIQELNIPFTRDCWRAACWLNTPNGRFYYQTIQHSGKEVKVLGGRGNNSVKELVKLKPIGKKKFVKQDCSKSCRLVGNIKINGLDELITESTNHQHSTDLSFTPKKLNTLPDSYSFQKPGPLSLKRLNPTKSSIDVELGPLELYSLPRIELEVWPKLDRPLPEAVHPYLKLALPYESITPEWAEFALSTLKQTSASSNRRKRKRADDTAVEPNRSFTFNIPYANNQSRILVRKRRKIVPPKLTKLALDEDTNFDFNFLKDVDQTDDVSVAVGDVLAGMINSVALGMCDATVVHDDPDIDYSKVDGELATGDNKAIGVNAFDGKKKITPAGKVVKELKKLNAKIIHGFDTIKKEECKNDFCNLGCICDSLYDAQTYSYHCKEIDCMFQCKCPSSKVNTTTFESAVHNSDIKQLCERMNASLAKEEKDFTATVVVRDGKTIYVPSTYDEKKKRLKKVPKRLSDCVQFESDFVHRPLSETLSGKREKLARLSQNEDAIDADDRALSTNRNDFVKSMVHVNVNVERLKILDELQPWCMVHCLYKCFCKLRATEGRRFEFSDAKIDIIEQPTYTKKRQYTFERSNDEPKIKLPRLPYAAADEDQSSCRRARVVATNHHKIVNRARSEDIRRRIRKIEQDHPGLKILLKNRVKRSIAMAEVGPMVTVNEVKPTTGSDPLRLDENTADKYRTRFNNIVMKTMQGISGKLKAVTTLPSPSNKAFYYLQWKHFLDAFNADRIYIWEVQLNTKEVLLIVTDKDIMPIVSDAMYVINIKAVSTERLPLLPKLIKLGVRNDETEKMSVLLFGVSNYWRVLGCTHSVNDFMHNRVVAVPTPDSNPRLASKISSLFDDMVKLTAQNRSKATPTIKSNICIHKLDMEAMAQIHVPIPVVGCHRWLMLSLASDFSHIYIPTWKQFISHKKIMVAMAHAKKTQRTVRWGPTDLKPQVFVPHNMNLKVFFGPMEKDEMLELQLLIQHEKKMFLREEYQRMVNLTPKGVTVGSWLYMKGEQHLDGDDSVFNVSPTERPHRTYPPKQRNVSSMQHSSKFIPLKPSTVTSSNINITISSPTIDDTFSNCATSTPTASTSTSSSNAPSSELVRQLSLGLRARPSKKMNLETSPIKLVDTKLLMSPKFLNQPESSFPPNDEQTQPDEAASQAKPTISSSNTQPIRARRFTMTASTDKPSLKALLQAKPPNAQQSNTSKPNSIRSRRYTTIVSSGGPPMSAKHLSQYMRISQPATSQSINVKNFELVQKPGNKLTLAPIPSIKPQPPKLLLNRPVVIKKVVPEPLARQQSPIDPNRSLSPSTKQMNVAKPSIIVVKPSTLKLNLPAKVGSASNALDGKSVIIKNINNKPMRLIPSSSLKIMGKDEIIKHFAKKALIIGSNSATRTAATATPSPPPPPPSSQPQPPPKRTILVHSSEPTKIDTVNGYLVSSIKSLGKIMAKKLFGAYSLNLPGGSKLFHTFSECTEYLNNNYIKSRVFAMVPAHLDIEWKFVSAEEDHVNYVVHEERNLRPSMVMTKEDLIDLNSGFDVNEKFSMDLKHHLLVLRLAHACMKNSEARHKTGLEIVRRSEALIKELIAENKMLENSKRALRIEKHLNVLKLSELKKKAKAMGINTSTANTSMDKGALSSSSSSATITTKRKLGDVITIDSDDD